MKIDLNKLEFTKINLIKLWELLISNSNGLRLGFQYPMLDIGPQVKQGDLF